MKRNLLIIRFGKPSPLPHEVRMTITKLVEGEDIKAAVGGPFGQIGLMSIIRTKLSPKEVVDAYLELDRETGDTLPVTVLDLDEGTFSLEYVGGFKEMCECYRQNLAEIGVTVPTAPTKIDMSLDELLDLVKELGGVDKLSQPHIQRLHELSKNL